jgi:hypothetical protein
MYISSKLHSDMSKSAFLADYDWTSLQEMQVTPPYVTGTFQPAASIRGIATDLPDVASMSTIVSKPSTGSTVPSYLESTIASRLGIATNVYGKDARTEEETEEPKYSPLFDPEDDFIFTGEDTLFAGF